MGLTLILKTLTILCLIHAKKRLAKFTFRTSLFFPQCLKLVSSLCYLFIIIFNMRRMLLFNTCMSHVLGSSIVRHLCSLTYACSLKACKYAPYTVHQILIPALLKYKVQFQQNRNGHVWSLVYDFLCLLNMRTNIFQPIYLRSWSSFNHFGLHFPVNVFLFLFHVEENHMKIWNSQYSRMKD